MDSLKNAARLDLFALDLRNRLYTTTTTVIQGWAQGSFAEAEAIEVKQQCTSVASPEFCVRGALGQKTENNKCIPYHPS